MLWWPKAHPASIIGAASQRFKLSDKHGEKGMHTLGYGQRWAMMVVMALATALLGTACGVSGGWYYESDVKVGKIPLSIEVQVTDVTSFSDTVYSGGSQGMSQLERALRNDIAANGPFTVDRVSPDAILRVRAYIVADGSGLTACTCASALIVPVPLFLLGIPCGAGGVQVSLSATLADKEGRTLAEYTTVGVDRRALGYYYGTARIEVAAAQAAERLRRELIRDSKLILARHSGKAVVWAMPRAAETAPKAKEPVAPPAPAPAPAPAVVYQPVPVFVPTFPMGGTGDVTPPAQPTRPATPASPSIDKGCPGRCFIRQKGCNQACSYSHAPDCYPQCGDQYRACIRQCQP